MARREEEWMREVKWREAKMREREKTPLNSLSA
jgi:hypothetical protein